MARTKRASTERQPVVPPKIFAQASPRSIGGLSVFDAGPQIRTGTVERFFSSDNLLAKAESSLRAAGFEVLQVSRVTINIVGTPAVFEKAFSTKIVAQERPVIKELAKKSTATFLDSPDTEMPGLISTAGTPFEDLIEGVAIEEPRYFMGASMFAPLRSYWHLRVPGDISAGANAEKAHRGGITGRGVRVAMCDTGWYPHPFFVARGYRAAPVVLGPGAMDPQNDSVGHGTGESANIFAIAPDAELIPVKMSSVNSIGAFNAAVQLAPDIITCSWGSSNENGPLSASDQALAAAIAAAVSSGITVVFSAGNGHWGFPGQHPDVISAGGVYLGKDEKLRASDYASGFVSKIYRGRRVPDLCGLVGLLPSAIYIMLPVEPDDEIDQMLSGQKFPEGDETTTGDGWAAFSGTSAAAPQIAGAAALLKQVNRGLKPSEIKDLLTKSARDVSQGNSSQMTGGNPATPGPDTATGFGLVDAHKAVLLAKVRSLGGNMLEEPAVSVPVPIPRPEPELSPLMFTKSDIEMLENLITRGGSRSRR